MPPNLSAGATFNLLRQRVRLTGLTLSGHGFRRRLKRTKTERIVPGVSTRWEAIMRAAVSDLVEILAIGLFVAGIGAMATAMHAVA